MLPSPGTYGGGSSWNRRRRNELDYPVRTFADDDEAAAAIATSTQIVDSAERILEQGALTRF
jgi:hypothetical protein